MNENPLPTTPFFDPQMPITFWRDKLPHWQQPGKTIFVTFRLCDSMPQSVMKYYQGMKEQFIRQHPYPWDSDIYKKYGELIASPLERYVDAGYGSCVLKYPEARGFLRSAIDHYDNDRMLVWAYVIMPNHVHMLATPACGYELATIIASIKKYSARNINRYMRRNGRLWQDEPFDTIVRSYRQYRRFVEYIRNNPQGLQAGTYEFGGLEFR